MKQKITKIQQHRGNHLWIDILHDVVDNYNSQVHRVINMRPRDVNEDNKYIAWGRLFGHVAEDKKPKFKVGDRVRVANFKESYAGSTFRKYYREKYGERKHKPDETRSSGYRVVFKTPSAVQAKKSPFTDEVFVVKKVLLGDVITYKLYSPEADVNILGKFYEDELSLVR